MSNTPDKTIFDDEVVQNLEENTRASVECPVLFLLSNQNMNQRYRIDKPQLNIGRDVLHNDITLNDYRCSRRHARVLYKNIEEGNQTPLVVLEDLNSTNGSFVNGVRVSGQHELKDRDKILVGSTMFGFFLRDESEIEADKRLLNLATTDALTGLNNRGVFNVEIQKEVDRAQRYGRPLSLVMFDIDHFKKFNDTYGHQIGDFVLQEMGRLILINTRSNDTSSRYGGEEFALILPETNMEGALIQAERLRSAVRNHPFTTDRTCFNITVSVGVASLEEDIRDARMLIQRADEALYNAKAEGRNRVCWFKDGQIHSREVTEIP